MRRFARGGFRRAWKIMPEEQCRLPWQVFRHCSEFHLHTLCSHFFSRLIRWAAPEPVKNSIFINSQSIACSTIESSSTMPQNEYIERWTKQHGRRLDYEERKRKREAREGHLSSKKAQNFRGLRAKMYAETRRKEKIQMKKKIKAHEERNVKSSAPPEPSSTALPQYLLDRSNTQNAKALSSQIKQKRAEKAAKFSVPLPKVRGISEAEIFSVVKTGKKTSKRSWKRVISKPTFVPADYTRRPVKYERLIRPMALRYKKANVTHTELGVTVQLPIIGVKKNPQNPL